MKSAYRALAGLVALGVFVQAALIAWGVFTVIEDVESGAVLTSDTELNTGQVLHGTVGVMVIPVIALALLIVSFFAKIPGGVRWAAIIFGLVVLQITFAFAAFGAPIIGALHGITALAILGTAVNASRLGRAAERTAPAQAASRSSV